MSVYIKIQRNTFFHQLYNSAKSYANANINLFSFAGKNEAAIIISNTAPKTMWILINYLNTKHFWQVNNLIFVAFPITTFANHWSPIVI